MDAMEKDATILEFMKLLNENGRQGQAEGLSRLMRYMDGMERQFDAVLQELQEVKQQLAQVSEQQAPSKKRLTRMVETLGARVGQAKKGLSGLRDKIVNCARDAVERFKDAGVSALDGAISAMGVKKALGRLQETLQASVAGASAAVARGEQVGRELRSVGSHLKNATRAAAGKEVSQPDVEREGRFQAAVLAPMRGVHKVLTTLNNNTLAAIGAVEHLEQTAETARDRRAERKPSVRKALAEKQSEIAAAAAPAQEKKAPEAAR